MATDSFERLVRHPPADDSLARLKVGRLTPAPLDLDPWSGLDLQSSEAQQALDEAAQELANFESDPLFFKRPLHAAEAESPSPHTPPKLILHFLSGIPDVEDHQLRLPNDEQKEEHEIESVPPGASSQYYEDKYESLESQHKRLKANPQNDLSSRERLKLDNRSAFADIGWSDQLTQPTMHEILATLQRLLLDVESLMSIQQLALAEISGENSPVAAQIILSVMLASLDKRLHIDKHVNAAVATLSNEISGLQSGGNTTRVIEIARLLARYVAKVRVDELVLTEIENFSIPILFTGTESLEGLRHVLVELLVSVFTTYDDRQQTIQHLIVSALAKHEEMRTPVALLIFKLIQSFDTAPVEEKSRRFLTLVVSSKNTAEIDSSRQEILDLAKKEWAKSQRCAIEFAAMFAQEAQRAESRWKAAFMSLIDATINRLGSPEWSGSAVFALCVSLVFSEHMANDGYFLDVVGKIANAFANLQPLDQNQSNWAFFVPEGQAARHVQLAQLSFVLNRVEAVRNDHFFPHGTDSPHNEDTRRLFGVLDGMLEAFSKHSVNPPSSSVSRADYVSFLFVSGGNALLGRFTDDVLVLLDSSKVKIATRAVKLIALMLENNRSVLSTPSVSSSIMKLLGGSSMAKEAVLDLIGKYIGLDSVLAELYHRAICSRSEDSSVSVKKRVLRLMKDMYGVVSVSAKAYMCSKMLSLCADEATVAALARSQLLVLLKAEDMCAEATEICAEVASSGADNLLKGFIENDSGWRRIAEQAFDVLSGHPEHGSESMKYMALLRTLAEADPSFFSRHHLEVLQSHYVDNGPCSLYALNILRLCVEKVSLSRQFLQHTQDLLFKRLTKMEEAEVYEAVSVLEFWTRHDRRPFVSAALSTIIHLKAMSDRSLSPKLLKLLTLLGAFGSCSLEDSRAQFVKVGLKDQESVPSLVVRHLLYFCQGDQEVATAATKGILHVAGGHSKLLISEPVMDILDRGLQSSNKPLKLTILRGLTRFLVAEDERASANSKGTSGRPNLSPLTESLHIGDAVCASICQRYIPHVLDMCIFENGLLPAQFVQLVLKLGYANPKTCMPTVLALGALADPSVRRIAFDLHQDIFEKHETLASSYGDAVLKAVAMGGHNRRFLRNIYGVIKGSYPARKKLIFALARLCDVNISLDLKGLLHQREVVVFVATNALLAPFVSLEEVCLLMYHLDRVVAIQGHDVAESVQLAMHSDVDVPTLQNLFVQSQSILAIVYLRQALALAYRVSTQTMETYRPGRPDVELRQRVSPKPSAFPLSKLHLGIGIHEPTQFSPVFSGLVSAIGNY